MGATKRNKQLSTAETCAAQDLRLLEEVLAGKQAAWTEFCNRFGGFVAGCVARVLRRYAVQLGGEGLDDLVGEVWVALLRDNCRKLRVYDPARGCRLTTWIGMIATNTVIDYLRVNHTPSAYIEDRPQVVAELVDHCRPDLQLEQLEQAELARRALSRLKAEEQRFMRYCFTDEWQPTRIAEVMGISINTVHSRKFKLRQKLCRLVAQLSPAC